MNICIVGWYGTETIGDRAILDGIINIFLTKNEPLKVYLGSLFPFYSERTLLEDDYSSKYEEVEFEIFDLYDKKDTKKAIFDSQIVVMGGGPLMDLNELYLIIRAFELAKQHRIKTALVGCGYGPLKSPEFINAVNYLLTLSDVSIFRDKESQQSYLKNCKSPVDTVYLEDPAIISVLKYKKENTFTKNECVCMNFREFPKDYYGNYCFSVEEASSIVKTFLDNTDKTITLFPMHSFFVGGDDRFFLNQISNRINSNRVIVINKPLSLFETYRLIAESQACFGMRYHSIVFETILNGNNYIMNYTDKESGKIPSFLREIGGEPFYSTRMKHVSEGRFNYSIEDSSFCFPEWAFETIIMKYREKLGIAKDE